ncbi:MAG: tetratricopeptide repeat protein, partial [Candidatus Woesearchaeota archaeon]
EDMRKKYGKRTANEFVDMIGSLLADYKYEEAFALYSQLKVQFPSANLSKEMYEKFRAYIDEGLLEGYLKNKQAAIAILRDYLLHFPNSPDADRLLLTLASLYKDEKNYDLAKSALSNLVSQYPQSLLVRLAKLELDELSILISVQNEGDSAIQKYESQKSSQDYDTKAQAHFRLGAIYYASNYDAGISGMDKSVLEFESVVKDFGNSPYSADAAYILGLMHQTDDTLVCKYYSSVRSYPSRGTIFDLSPAIKTGEKLLEFGCSADETDYVDTSPVLPVSGICDNSAKLANVDPVLVQNIPKIESAVGASFCVHDGCAISGHVERSLHYIKSGENYCKAVDFHLVYQANASQFSLQVASMYDTLKSLGLAGKAGFGVYPQWNSPGFHLDLRGYSVLWVNLNNDYKYGTYDMVMAKVSDFESAT